LDQNELEHDYSWNNDVMRGRMRRSVRGDPGSIRNMYHYHFLLAIC
jgi:hypothetical protein